MINITLNGKPSQIQTCTTVSDLLLKWKVRAELVTVEVNENILQKLDYDTKEIKAGDEVNFVFYMGGGSAPPRFSSRPPVPHAPKPPTPDPPPPGAAPGW